MHWPMLIHFCESCRYNTPVEYTGTVWQQDHSCTHCGLKSPGADIAGRTTSTMNSDQHDELAQLFAANMQVSYQQQQPQQQPQPQYQPAEPVQVDMEKVEQGPMHYISSHYTGTAHILPTNTIASPSRSPPPSYTEATMMPEAMAEMLKQNGVDPSSLLPNQVHLFANADQEQRGRLLELWRISPPSYPLEQHLGNGGTEVTSVEQEEADARARYEQQQHQQQQQQRAQEEWGLDTHIPPSHQQQQEPTPLSPIREPGEPAWPPAARMRAASILAAARQNQTTPPQQSMQAEPYMTNGYQASVDPVYAASTDLWQQQQTPTPNYSYGNGYAEAMARDARASRVEDSYGQFEQIRNHAEWEAMQERVARERLMFVGGGDDMVM
ncbi:hypothetical protein LTS10_006042 [Elasticomyces elasticus]|nr:hypothetical protein LTS10_006042 [Elasticomyces elasticus]